MAKIPWFVEDPVTAEMFVFPLNPSEDTGGSHSVVKNVNYSVKTGFHRRLDGADQVSNILSVAGFELQRGSYSGVVTSKEDLDLLNLWVAKDYELELVDDLGRRFVVLFERLDLSRVRSVKYPFKHSYVLSFLIVREII